MLIPDNIHPEQTVYFNAAYVLRTLQRHLRISTVDLYIQTLAERKMTMPIFVLCLDWLFLLGIVTLTDDGEVELCS